MKIFLPVITASQFGSHEWLMKLASPPPVLIDPSMHVLLSSVNRN
jgi:hypothetical protein